MIESHGRTEALAVLSAEGSSAGGGDAPGEPLVGAEELPLPYALLGPHVRE